MLEHLFEGIGWMKRTVRTVVAKPHMYSCTAGSDVTGGHFDGSTALDTSSAKVGRLALQLLSFLILTHIAAHQHGFYAPPIL
jgi:hypothetical protein